MVLENIEKPHPSSNQTIDENNHRYLSLS